MSTVGASTKLSDDQGPAASQFSSMPRTNVAWVGIALALAYIALATVMANTVLGLPTWLDFSLGLIPGAAATILLLVAIIGRREHSWLLFVTLAALLFVFGGWVVFAGMAFL